jgi:hypothetical protein
LHCLNLYLECPQGSSTSTFGTNLIKTISSKKDYFHKNYILGDKHNLKTEDFESFDEMAESVLDNGIYLPLYLYDHSGITMSYKPFGCRWDSGQVGFIYMTAQDIKKEYGSDTPENRLKAM